MLLNIAFHGCTIFDIRDKVVFSVHFANDSNKQQFPDEADLCGAGSRKICPLDAAKVEEKLEANKD